MGKRKNKSKGNSKNKPGYARANHLQSCATFLSMFGTKKNDGFAKISRKVSKLCRQVMDSDMVQIEPEKKRQFCKKCREVLVGKIEKAKLVSKQRNSITRICGNCGNEKKYMTINGYGAELKKQANI